MGAVKNDQTGPFAWQRVSTSEGVRARDRKLKIDRRRRTCVEGTQGCEQVSPEKNSRTSTSTSAMDDLPWSPAVFAALVLGLIDRSTNSFVVVVVVVAVVAVVALPFAAQVAVQLGEEAAEVNCAASFTGARFRSLRAKSEDVLSTVMRCSRTFAGDELRGTKMERRITFSVVPTTLSVAPPPLSANQALMSRGSSKHPPQESTTAFGSLTCILCWPDGLCAALGAPPILGGGGRSSGSFSTLPPLPPPPSALLAPAAALALASSMILRRRACPAHSGAPSATCSAVSPVENVTFGGTDNRGISVSRSAGRGGQRKGGVLSAEHGRRKTGGVLGGPCGWQRLGRLARRLY